MLVKNIIGDVYMLVSYALSNPYLKFMHS